MVAMARSGVNRTPLLLYTHAHSVLRTQFRHIRKERTFVSVFGTDRICAVVARRSASELLSGLRMAARESAVVELRFDWLTKPTEIPRAIEMVGKEMGRRVRSRSAKRLCL